MATLREEEGVKGVGDLADDEHAVTNARTQQATVRDQRGEERLLCMGFSFIVPDENGESHCFKSTSLELMAHPVNCVISPWSKLRNSQDVLLRERR